MLNSSLLRKALKQVLELGAKILESCRVHHPAQALPCRNTASTKVCSSLHNSEEVGINSPALDHHIAG